MMVTCPSLGELTELLSGGLGDERRGEVSCHVDTCHVCQLALDKMTTFTSADLVGDVAHREQDPAGQDWILSQLIQRLRKTSSPMAPGASRSSPTSSLDPDAPLSLDDFDLGERIGRGGMGSVYRAIQKSLKKPVAIKLLEDIRAGDEQLVARFFREAHVAASLSHPNIVDVHGIGRTPSGSYFLVMDLVEGRDLEQMVEANETAELDIATTVATVAEAIQHAHDHGIIHRDLKPSNILIGVHGEVMITDFGIAKSLDPRGPTSTLSGQLLGTPGYMAPEQAAPVSALIGPSTDVYGLGGILYFLLTRRTPYTMDDGGSLGVIEKVLGADLPPPPSQHSADVPPQLESICMRCLSKTPAERYPTARDVADALWAVAGPQPAGQPAAAAILHEALPEPPSGAVALGSRYYLIREQDELYEQALARSDSIVLVRGARQMGKTSLMARGLQKVRQAGTHVVLTDIQKLNTSELQSAETLFLALAEWLVERLGLTVSLHDSWNARRGASANFERFLRREVLARLNGPLVWGLDEVDRLFPCEFSSEVFGLFRSWHNERALDPAGPWSRLTLAMAYATEAHLFIADINQSPFNVGTRISLSDFSSAQVAELNRRYENPLASGADVERFVELVGGQPYLVNRSLYEMKQRAWSLPELIEHAGEHDGIFGDHLRRMIVLLGQDTSLQQALASFVHDRGLLNTEQFYRLRSAGVLSGDSAATCRLRCGLYQRYLEKQLSAT